MAWRTTATVAFLWLDASGSTGLCKATRFASSIAQVSAAARDLAAALTGASGCVITGYNILVENVLSPPTIAGTEVANYSLVLTIECEDTSVYVMRIPGVSSVVLAVADDAGVIPVDTPEVQSLFIALKDAGYCSETGYEFLSLTSAAVEFTP